MNATLSFHHPSVGGVVLLLSFPWLLGNPAIAHSAVHRVALPRSVVQTCSPQPDGEWTLMSANGAPRFSYGIWTDIPAVWTGREVILWGERIPDGGVIIGSGARYDPHADTWRPVSDINAPSRRYAHSAVWTGREMLVWGGEASDQNAQDGNWFTELNDGAAYDQVADTWRPITQADAPWLARGHRAVWTGTEMIVWGHPLSEASRARVPGPFAGARYNPATDAWSQLPPLPEGISGDAIVWTGTELIIWGSPHNESVSGRSGPGTGARWNPQSDSWTPTTTVGAPSERFGATAIWTGTRMILWGGLIGRPTVNGAIYDPGRDEWGPMTSQGAPGPRDRVPAVWTGKELLMWAGSGWPNRGSTFPLEHGAAYNPETNSWRPLPASPLGPRQRHSAVWTGADAIFFGGLTADRPGLTTPYAEATGAAYRPPCS